MKIKIETNFSFNKLAGKVDSIIDKYKEGLAGAYAQGAKDRIDKKEVKKLHDYTIKVRKHHGQYKYGLTQPLKETGNLYNSIKGTKEGLVMLDYGNWTPAGAKNTKQYKDHNKPGGFDTTLVNLEDTAVKVHVPQREFYGEKFVSKKLRERANKSIVKNIRKGMKK